jgi:hypothetical protein
VFPHPISHKIVICCVSHGLEGANWMDKCNPGAIAVLETYLNVFHYSCVRSQVRALISDYLSKMDMSFKNCCPMKFPMGRFVGASEHGVGRMPAPEASLSRIPIKQAVQLSRSRSLATSTEGLLCRYGPCGTVQESLRHARGCGGIGFAINIA